MQEVRRCHRAYRMDKKMTTDERLKEIEDLLLDVHPTSLVAEAINWLITQLEAVTKERDELKDKEKLCLICHRDDEKLKDENDELKEKLTAAKHEVKLWERVANEWMQDHDKLKEKYEPMTLVESRE